MTRGDDEEHGTPRSSVRRWTRSPRGPRRALEGDVEPEEHPSEPLVDPADGEAMAAELKMMMSKAAEPDKD
jgi:hypothetical protein